MPISINGSGTVTGVSVGGLPDGIVDADMLASNSVTSGKLASGVGGKVLQVVHANYGTQTSTSANSYSNSGLTASITPSSSSSKILVTVCQSYRLAIGGATAISGAIKIFREQGGTETAVSSPQDYFLYVEAANTTSQYSYDVMTQIVQDSPNTTSAVSYKTKQRIYNSMGTLITQYNGDSYITLMEIAA